MGFDDCRVDPAHVLWAETPSGSNCSIAAVSSIGSFARPSSQICLQLSLRSRIKPRYLTSWLNMSLVPLILGRVNVGTFYLLVKGFVSVLEGLTDSSKFSIQTSTINRAKFNLSDSVQSVVSVNYGVITKRFESSQEWVDCQIPEKWRHTLGEAQ